MRKIIYLLFLPASLACSGAVSAQTIVYYAEPSDLNSLLTSPSTLALDIPYDSSVWSAVTSATLSFLLSDDHGPGDGNDRADITTVEGNSIVFGAFQIAGGSALTWQAATFNVPDTFLIDGMLDFFLKADIGDFYYHNARLTVNYTPVSVLGSEVREAGSAVPEPGTALLLMGGGLMLMGLLARRRIAGGLQEKADLGLTLT